MPFLFLLFHVPSDTFPTKALCLAASALGSFIHSSTRQMFTECPQVMHCPGRCGRTHMNSVWSSPPGQSAGQAWRSQASPGQQDHGALRAGKGSGRRLASCLPKVFPRENWMRARSHPGSARDPLGRQGPGRARRGPGLDLLPQSRGWMLSLRAPAGPSREMWVQR